MFVCVGCTPALGAGGEGVREQPRAAGRLSAAASTGRSTTSTRVKVDR